MASIEATAVQRTRPEPRVHTFAFGVRDAIVSGPLLVIAVWYLVFAANRHAFAFDFEQTFWPAGRHVLSGESPFPPVTSDALATGSAFVYPAFAALVMAPFAALPMHVAAVLFTTLLLACALLTLHVLGVRDWRCYLAVLAWGPVLSALQTGNVTLLLALGAALVWRFRDRTTLAALLTGVLIALKLFLWPLLVWLLVTRRYASALQAAMATLLITLGSWAVLGFAGFADFVPMMRLLARLEERTSYGPMAIGLRLGLGYDLAHALALLVAAAAIVGLVVLARRNDDEGSFVLALVAAVLFSPLVWLHYFALFIVAIALLRPTFSALWLLPFVALLAPARATGPSWWTLLVLGIFTVVLVAGLARRGPMSVRPEPA